MYKKDRDEAKPMKKTAFSHIKQTEAFLSLNTGGQGWQVVSALGII
jgi:hypothetical protein